MKCNLFPFFFLVGYSLWGGGGISGRVRALNLTVPLGSARVGSDNLGYGPGSGFSFEPMQTSTTGSFPNLTKFTNKQTAYQKVMFLSHKKVK